MNCWSPFLANRTIRKSWLIQICIDCFEFDWFSPERMRQLVDIFSPLKFTSFDWFVGCFFFSLLLCIFICWCTRLNYSSNRHGPIDWLNQTRVTFATPSLQSSIFAAAKCTAASCRWHLSPAVQFSRMLSAILLPSRVLVLGVQFSRVEAGIQFVDYWN